MFKNELVQFVVMVIVGMAFNPMNVLAFRMNDLYLSLTLFYGGLLMASNMIWSHQIIHYINMGHFNKKTFFIGVLLSTIFTVLFLRRQLLVDDKQWLRRMISHHSTALTTSHIIRNKTNNNAVKKLADDIIVTQEKEIKIMTDLL